MLRKTNRHIAWDPKERDKINECLAAADLKYDQDTQVRTRSTFSCMTSAWMSSPAK